jgi:hypothetical protein
MIVLVATLVLGATSALALGPLDAEAELAVYSKYVWRGIVTVDDYVLQPSVGLGIAGFHAGFWGNVDMTDINSGEGFDTEWKFTEIDWTLGWGMSLPLVDLGLGFIYYTFPQADGVDTTELYLSGQVNVLLNPSLVIYQDLDLVKGGYWDFNVSHGFALGATNSLEVGAGLGLGSKSYMDGYFGSGGVFIPENELGTSMADFRISAAVPFNPVPMFTVTPSVTYTSLLGDAKDAVDGSDGMLWYGKSDAFFWGLSAGFSF